MILHTVNKSPFEKNSLERCIESAKDGAAILLIEDGVYGALNNTAYSDMAQNAMKTVKIYALAPDVQARGVGDRVLDGVELVDYNGFVDLAESHSKVQAWL
ncbi:MAG: sulfurtransferase complex subunit TusB [Gammaproteobacteria bacterium]|nr:sulfurtransferase complex subunit TusB [Gammaproteobacteria bacterium]MDH5729551.1 sulfurtransferase complex subunit TusB [Gammaproteobacteria bacterium]